MARRLPLSDARDESWLPLLGRGDDFDLNFQGAAKTKIPDTYHRFACFLELKYFCGFFVKVNFECVALGVTCLSTSCAIFTGQFGVVGKLEWCECGAL